MNLWKNLNGAQRKAQLGYALGGVVTLAVILTFGLAWLFAFNQLGYPYFWERPGQISGEEWQNHIRNAATLVGVPGVAAALVFSYFKQRTSDKTQETTSGGLQLQRDEQAAGRITDLRARYTTAAELLGSQRLPSAIAAVHTLQSLADDWALAGNQTERQNCINLLTSYLRLAGENAKEEDATVYEGVRPLILDIVFEKLQQDLNYREYWNATFELGNKLPELVRDLYVLDAVIYTKGISPEAAGITLWGLTLESGVLEFEDLSLAGGPLIFRDCLFKDGLLEFGPGGNGARGLVKFLNCTFSGARLNQPYGYRNTVAYEFIGCTFSGGRIEFDTDVAPRRVVIKSSSFTQNIFTDRPLWQGLRYADEVRVSEDCSFTGEATPLPSFTRHLMPEHIQLDYAALQLAAKESE